MVLAVLPESIATTNGRLIPLEELELLEEEELELELELDDEELVLLDDELELLEDELELLLELLEEDVVVPPQPIKTLDATAAANQPNS